MGLISYVRGTPCRHRRQLAGDVVPLLADRGKLHDAGHWAQIILASATHDFLGECAVLQGQRHFAERVDAVIDVVCTQVLEKRTHCAIDRNVHAEGHGLCHLRCDFHAGGALDVVGQVKVSVVSRCSHFQISNLQLIKSGAVSTRQPCTQGWQSITGGG